MTSYWAIPGLEQTSQPAAHWVQQYWRWPSKLRAGNFLTYPIILFPSPVPSYNSLVFLSADRRDGLRCGSGWIPDTAISPPDRHLGIVLGRLTPADIGQSLPNNTLGIEERFEINVMN